MGTVVSWEERCGSTVVSCQESHRSDIVSWQESCNSFVTTLNKSRKLSNAPFSLSKSVLALS